MMMMDVLHEKILEMRVTSLEEEKAFLQQERMKCLSLFAKIIMACEATNGCVSMSANSEQHFCLRVSGRGQTVFEKTFPMDEVNMHTLPDILMDLFAQEETTWKISWTDVVFYERASCRAESQEKNARAAAQNPQQSAKIYGLPSPDIPAVSGSAWKIGWRFYLNNSYSLLHFLLDNKIS